MIPFVMFIKGDAVEHDKHSSKYSSRQKGVKFLCRYCVLPTTQSDVPYLDPEPERKSQEMIQALVVKGDKDALKNTVCHSTQFGMRGMKLNLDRRSIMGCTAPAQLNNYTGLTWGSTNTAGGVSFFRWAQHQS